jgi:acetyl esterase/lipase
MGRNVNSPRHLALWITLLVARAYLPLHAQSLPAYIERPVDAAGIYAIWPGSGVPPGAEKWTWHEQTEQTPGSKTPNRRTRNVVIPTITMFRPAAGNANGTAAIIAPGGAFTFLMVDYEGYNMARWLAKQGVTAFVLKYRVAHSPENEAELGPFLDKLRQNLSHPGPTVTTPPALPPIQRQARSWGEEDGRQAIRFVRQHAAQWKIDPHRIGIAGFSAGGGVVMGAVMHHDGESRPDFAAPIYGAYEAATPVPPDAPPLFIAAADDDQLVAPISGARLYDAWHAAGKPAELHIFVKGAHGFGMKHQNLPSDAWIELLKNWMDALGYLPPPVK